MLELMQSHLDTCFSPEEGSLIEEAIRLLAEMNVDTDDFYSNLFMEWEQGHIENINTAIRSAVLMDCMNVVAAHGFSLVETAKLSDYLQFMRFFVQVENYENQEQLLMIAESEEMDSVEKLATALEEVLLADVANTMALLEDVPEIVLKNMANYARDRINETPADMSEALESRAAAEALQLFATKIQGKDMKCYKHVFEAEAAVGLPLALYWKTYYSYLVSIPVQAMVYELIGFTLISEEATQNPSDAIGAILTEYYGSDIDKIAYAKTLINQTLIEFRNEASSGVFVQRPEPVNAKA